MDTPNPVTNAHERSESNGFSSDYVTTTIGAPPRDFRARERNKAGDRPRGNEFAVQTNFQSDRVSYERAIDKKQPKTQRILWRFWEQFRLSVVFGVLAASDLSSVTQSVDICRSAASVWNFSSIGWVLSA